MVKGADDAALYAVSVLRFTVSRVAAVRPTDCEIL